MRKSSGVGRCAGLAITGLLSLSTLGSGPAAAGEPSLAPARTITGKFSPFGKCTADDVAGQDGENFPNAEIEPWVDANPADPKNLIAGWQQDRWSNGGARGLATGASKDGGKTWTTVVPPKLTKCAGGPWTRASDPWVTFAKDGTAYFMSLAFQPDLPDGRFGKNAMLVSRSTDGGLSWSKPLTLREDQPGQALNDKNSMTADPQKAKFVYAVWDRLVDFSLPEGLNSDGARGAKARALFLRGLQGDQARAGQVFFKGPSLFTRTINAGASWSKSRVVYDPGDNAQTINNLVAVQPNGTVSLFFTEITPSGKVFISQLDSKDKGATFATKPVHAAEIELGANGAVLPDTKAPIRDASILFDVGVDPKSGQLYLVWQDRRFAGIEQVAMTTSTDGGKTWAKPFQVDQTPGNKVKLRRQAIIPSVAVGEDGRVVVTYYDFRNDDDSGELADYWAVVCKASCGTPENWTTELRLTDTSFDFADAPIARGNFLGDYMGLTVNGNSAYAVFGITDGPNKTVLKSRRIDLE